MFFEPDWPRRMRATLRGRGSAAGVDRAGAVVGFAAARSFRSRSSCSRHSRVASVSRCFVFHRARPVDQTVAADLGSAAKPAGLARRRGRRVRRRPALDAAAAFVDPRQRRVDRRRPALRLAHAAEQQASCSSKMRVTEPEDGQTAFEPLAAPPVELPDPEAAEPRIRSCSSLT